MPVINLSKLLRKKIGLCQKVKNWYNRHVRNELRKKYFLDWGQVFSRRDDLASKPSIELVTVSRKSVAKAGEVEFISPPSTKGRNKVAQKKFKWSWDLSIGVIFLVIGINLFFTSGGILELIESKVQIQNGEKYLSQLEKENRELKDEINKLNHSVKYQKKVAREHLGAIAEDEFLIIIGD